MTKKPILIVSASKSNDESLLEKSLNAMKSTHKFFKKEYKLKMYKNNTEPLPVIYNKHINHNTLKNHDIVLFVHDDVFIDDIGCFDKLRTAIFKYSFDIIGLAGCTNAVIKKPCLWHIMAPRENHSGAVAHYNLNDNTMHTTSFGSYPKRCLMLDGLFLGVNVNRALETDWSFDTDFKFHHYDLASCLSANDKKLKMTTWNIHVVHASPGLKDYNDPSYQSSQDTFLQKYSNVE